MIFKTLEDGCYLAADAEYGIEFRIDRLGRDRRALVGELSVSCGMLGTQAIDGELTAGSFNFHNIRDRDDWAKRLARLARMGRQDRVRAAARRTLPTRDCRRARGHHGRGHSAHRASPPSGADVRHSRDAVLPEHPSAPFGEGDSLKSWLALKQANEQARAGVRVGYFDWELDAPEQRLRQATIDPELPDIIYVRCERPLIRDIDRLRRIGRRERLEFGWFDSAAFLMDGKPEDAVSVLATMRALRQLEIVRGSSHTADDRTAINNRSARCFGTTHSARPGISSAPARPTMAPRSRWAPSRGSSISVHTQRSAFRSRSTAIACTSRARTSRRSRNSPRVCRSGSGCAPPAHGTDDTRRNCQ